MQLQQRRSWLGRAGGGRTLPYTTWHRGTVMVLVGVGGLYSPGHWRLWREAGSQSRSVNMLQCYNVIFQTSNWIYIIEDTSVDLARSYLPSYLKIYRKPNLLKIYQAKKDNLNEKSLIHGHFSIYSYFTFSKDSYSPWNHSKAKNTGIGAKLCKLFTHFKKDNQMGSYSVFLIFGVW